MLPPNFSGAGHSHGIPGTQPPGQNPGLSGRHPGNDFSGEDRVQLSPENLLVQEISETDSFPGHLVLISGPDPPPGGPILPSPFIRSRATSILDGRA